jgi:hypothetical protein
MASAKTKTRKTAKSAPRPRSRTASKHASKAHHAPKSQHHASKAQHHAAKAQPKPAPRQVIRPPKSAVRLPDKSDKNEPTPASQAHPFKLVAIERADPPTGADGKNWYRYTITQGANAINGYLQGTANGVKHAAEQIVGQLNERRAGRWGYRTTRAATPAQAS